MAFSKGGVPKKNRAGRYVAGYNQERDEREHSWFVLFPEKRALSRLQTICAIGMSVIGRIVLGVKENPDIISQHNVTFLPGERSLISPRAAGIL